MSSFKLQVHVWDSEVKNYVWKDIHPSQTDEPYRFETEDEAQHVKNMNYPGEVADFIRIIPCEEEPNYFSSYKSN